MGLIDTATRNEQDSGVIEGEVREETTALAVLPKQPMSAISSFDPDLLIARATKQATALKAIIDQRKLFANISGRRHVTVEGWQTLGALNGLQAFTESVTVAKDEDGNLTATALVSARRVTDGIAIAQAEGFCSTKEAKWKSRDEYAVRSMAQTRATSKVFRQALAWVMTLAGYEATPAEEVPHGESREPELDAPTIATIAAAFKSKETAKETKQSAAAWMVGHKYVDYEGEDKGTGWSRFKANATNDEAAELMAILGIHKQEPKALPFDPEAVPVT